VPSRTDDREKNTLTIIKFRMPRTLRNPSTLGWGFARVDCFSISDRLRWLATVGVRVPEPKKEPALEGRSEWVRHPQRLTQGQASKKGIDRVAWSAIQANSAEQFS